MSANLLALRAATAERATPSGFGRSPDSAFAAIARLKRLRDSLASLRPTGKPTRWREPPVFFFDPFRQSAFGESRPQPDRPSLNDAVAAELPALSSSVDVRRAARSIPGLREAALGHGSVDLVALLDVPDDEAVVVLHPELRLGFRLLVRGVADVAQFHLLLLDAAGDLLPGPALPSRFRTACAEANPVVPAGVPMIAEARFQFFRPSALQPDGSLPAGFRGCDHWLWGTQPLAAVPRIDGERIVLIGTPAFRQTWEIERRFPAMAADVRLLEVFSPFRTLERLSTLLGQPLRMKEPASAAPALARAA